MLKTRSLFLVFAHFNLLLTYQMTIEFSENCSIKGHEYSKSIRLLRTQFIDWQKLK